MRLGPAFFCPISCAASHEGRFSHPNAPASARSWLSALGVVCLADSDRRLEEKESATALTARIDEWLHLGSRLPVGIHRLDRRFRAPPTTIDEGIGSARLLAYIVTGKFCDRSIVSKKGLRASGWSSPVGQWPTG